MWSLNTAICNAQNNDVVPQVEHMGPSYQWNAPDSVTQIRSNEPLAVRPNMRAFHLDPATNLTDVISQGYIYTVGLLVSERFYDVLRGCVVQAHEAYPAEVVHRAETFRYVWMHMTELLEPCIDFERSTFIIRPHQGPEQSVRFAAPDELRQKARELVNTIGPVRLVADRIVFRPGTPRFDLFGIVLTGRLFLVSDSLADRLRSGRFTGFTLEESSTAVVFA
jgi:hypothetical protein